MNKFNKVSSLFVHTKSSLAKSKLLKGHINPLLNKNNTKPNKLKINGFTPLGTNTFSTLDLETMDYKGVQIPVAISISSIRSNGRIINDFFIIKGEDNIELEVDNMFNEFFGFLSTRKDISYKTIFVHNLGSFDGLYIFNYLCKLYPEESPHILLDNAHKFIRISINLRSDFNVKFIDSCRIFPINYVICILREGSRR